MHTIISGNLLIGITAAQKCPYCNNLTHFKIFQEYIQQKLVGLTISRQYCGIKKLCPICEKGEWLIQRNLLIPKERKLNTLREMEGGKAYMREYVRTLSANDRDLILQRINKLGGQDLVIFLAT